MTIATAYIFDNGNLMVFDKEGGKIPDHQFTVSDDEFPERLLDLLMACDFDTKFFRKHPMPEELDLEEFIDRCKEARRKMKEESTV